jgi:hypothetical protein
MNDASGIVGFDNTNNQYFINKYVDGTIDEIYTLYPCDLASEFKKSNLHVVFSGDLFISDDLPKPAIGGQQIFHVKISMINQNIEPAQDLSGQWMWLSSWFDGNLSDSNPKTPQNSGLQETIRFNSDKSWIKIQNNVGVDSGKYSTGHGSYLPYIGAYNYVYDSVVYLRNGISVKGTQDYYKIFNDTLQFCGGFAGLMGSGSRFYIKQ